MKLKISLVLLILAMTIGCEKKKEDNSLLALAGLASASGSNSSSRTMYTGFADIPASIYQSTSTTSGSIQADPRTLATTDYRFVNSNNSSSVTKIYDLVRVTAKSTRDITKSIGDLVKHLEAIGVDTAQGEGTWGEPAIASKYKYQKTDAILAGGKKLEVWWNGGAALYGNNKAIELNYKGSSSAGNISGFVFARFLSKVGATTLSKAYIKFDYDAATFTRTMVVILQNIGDNYDDNAHFFVQEVNGVVALDGTYTVKGFNASTLPGVAAAGRAYVFSAIGTEGNAVIRAALPLLTDNSTDVYSNTSLANIGQVWTNFIFANATTASTINAIPVTGCSGQISTTPSSGNPTTLTGVTTVATLKSCLDAVINATSSTDAVKDVYFLTNIKNPAYFSVSGGNASLYGVESLELSDPKYVEFSLLQGNEAFLNSTRTISAPNYKATLDATTVGNLNLFTGTGIPAGTSATDLTDLNAQWGNGTPSDGTSISTAGTNTVNGSSDNTAPF